MEFEVKFIQDLAIILLAASVGAKGARLFGISSIAGYLVAGLLIGTADFILLEIIDPQRLKTLAHIGIVFVMFSIGLDTRLSELRSSGLAPFVAASMTALIMLSIGRIAGGLVGLHSTESLFFTAMLMISSSVMVNKHLTKLGLLHRRSGQMARSHTMLETVLAVILLTILGPLAGHEHPLSGWSALLQTFGKLAAFTILFVVAGMLLIPRMLRKSTSDPDGELQTIFLTGILFALSLITVFAGYSLALGAFLTGLVTSEIPRSQAAERMFAGIRDVFRAVFFVVMGMATDLRLMAGSLELILLGTAIAIAGRLLASTTAWTLACEKQRSAAQIAMLVTPTGAFSLIIAKLGIESGAIPESLHNVAIGIVFLTGIFGSVSVRCSEAIEAFTAPRFLQVLSQPLAAYRELWQSIAKRGGTRFLWIFIKPRIWQISREFSCVSALFIFANPLYAWLDVHGGLSQILPGWGRAVVAFYWFIVASITLPFLVALIRNLDAICMMVSDFLMKQSDILRRLHRAHIGLLRLLIFGMVGLWLFSLVPWETLNWQTLSLLGLLMLALIGGGWRRLVRIHNQIELDLNGMVARDFAHRNGALDPSQLDAVHMEWKLQLKELQLPDFFFGAGRSLDELNLRSRTGAGVVGIDRQGLALTRLNPQTQLFSGDTLFLLGRSEQIQAAVELLSRDDPGAATAKQLHRSILEPAYISPDCALTGQMLVDLNWSRTLGIQVLAIRRQGVETVNPGPSWVLAPGDELLLAGTAESLGKVAQSLAARCAPKEDNAEPVAASAQVRQS